MSTHTKQLFLGSQDVHSATVLYTCPSGKRTIVKTLRLLQSGSGSVSIIVYVAHGSGALAYLAFIATTGSALNSVTNCWDVLEAGDQLGIVVTGGTGNCLMLISGTELAVTG